MKVLKFSVCIILFLFVFIIVPQKLHAFGLGVVGSYQYTEGVYELTEFRLFSSSVIISNADFNKIIQGLDLLLIHQLAKRHG